MNANDWYEFLTSPWVLAALALLLERWLPWPEQWHPLAIFRLFANYLQYKVNKSGYAAGQQRIAGWLALITLLILSLVPTAIVIYAAEFSQIIGALVLLACLRQSNYLKTLDKVHRLASKGQKRAARAWLSRIDQRDTHELSLHGLAKNSLELRALSILHHRMVPISAWLIGGPILCLGLRLITELNQLWPTEQRRFRQFGLAPRAAYAMTVSWITAVMALLASTLCLLKPCRKRQSLQASQGWLWTTGWWLDSLSRLHNISLGGPIKIQGIRVARQRFPGRPAEEVWQSAASAIMRWQWLPTLIVLTGIVLSYIYRP